jgi:tyrosyl-tRNA synthetase
LVEKFLKIFTEVPLEEIEKLAKLEGAELNEAKKILAFAATEIAHGTKAAQESADAAAALFSGVDAAHAPSVDYKIPGTVPNIVDFTIAVGLFPSKSEARRAIEQGGLSVNDERVANINQVVLMNIGGYLMLKKGKKTFLRVNIK